MTRMRWPRWWTPIGWALGLALTEVIALYLLPPGIRQGASMAAVVAASSVLVTAGLIVRRIRRALRGAATGTRIPSYRLPEQSWTTQGARPSSAAGETTPDRAVLAVWILARHGYDAMWLADRFDLPLTFTELVVIDARTHEDTPPRS